MPSLESPRGPRRKWAKKIIPGIVRDDSDDELGTDDLPWEWIYSSSRENTPVAETPSRKRKRTQKNQIIGARMGSFECHLGDTVLLKAEGSNEAWVALICEFVEDQEDGEKEANFMWFSTEKEIRNREKKRTDFYWVRTLLLLTAQSCIYKADHTLYPERAVHIPIVGHEPPGLD